MNHRPNVGSTASVGLPWSMAAKKYVESCGMVDRGDVDDWMGDRRTTSRKYLYLPYYYVPYIERTPPVRGAYLPKYVLQRPHHMTSECQTVPLMLDKYSDNLASSVHHRMMVSAQ